jgi:hypothetical protein
MSEFNTPKNFVEGLFIKDRTDRTPDWILASYSINISKFKAWLDAQEQHAVRGWLNIDIKKSKETGKKYAELNTYQPQNPSLDSAQAPQQPINDQSPVTTTAAPVMCDACLTQGVVHGDGHDCIPF